MAEIMAKLARRANSSEVMELAGEFGYVKPEFKIVNFNVVEMGLVLKGRGTYNASTLDAVKTDIATAKAFVNFLKKQYGVTGDVGYSLMNNTAEITISIMNVNIDEATYNSIASHYEDIVLWTK